MQFTIWYMTYTMIPFVFKQNPVNHHSSLETHSPLLILHRLKYPQHELYALLINNFHFIHTVGPLLKTPPQKVFGDIKTLWRYWSVRIKLMATHWGGVGWRKKKGGGGSEAMSRMWCSTNCLRLPPWLSATHILGCRTRRWAESNGSRRLCVSSLDWWLGEGHNKWSHTGRPTSVCHNKRSKALWFLRSRPEAATTRA